MGPTGECPCDGCCAAPNVRDLGDYPEEFASDPAAYDSAWADLVGWVDCINCKAMCFCNV